LALKKKNEGYTFSKAKKSSEKKEINNNNEMPLDIVTEYPQRPEQLFKIQQMKEKVKKAHEKRAEIINMINP
jgi:cytochrome c2